jgi:hypothetical protein
MKETVSPFRHAAGLVTALGVIAAVAFSTLGGIGQNNDGRKIRIEDATYRDGETVRAKSGYELFVKENKIYAREHSASTKETPSEGGYVCTCDGSGGGDCMPVVDTRTGDGHCYTPIKENRCSHCKISFER